MLNFTPKSNTATVKPGPLLQGKASRQVTSLTRSRPTRPGDSCALLHKVRWVRIACGDYPFHRPPDPQVAGKGPRVDPLDPDLVVFFQVCGEGHFRAPVARDRLVFLDNEGLRMNRLRLDIFRVNPVVADQGIGHGDYLPLVGRVGEDLLITGHARVEDDLALSFALAGKTPPGKNRPVFKCQVCLHPPYQLMRTFTPRAESSSFICFIVNVP